MGWGLPGVELGSPTGGGEWGSAGVGVQEEKEVVGLGVVGLGAQPSWQGGGLVVRAAPLSDAAPRVPAGLN